MPKVTDVLLDRSNKVNATFETQGPFGVIFGPFSAHFSPFMVRLWSIISACISVDFSAIFGEPWPIREHITPYRRPAEKPPMIGGGVCCISA